MTQSIGFALMPPAHFADIAPSNIGVFQFARFVAFLVRST